MDINYYLCIMNQEFIPYDLALKLKDLGFDEPCWAWWHIEDCDIRFCYSEQRSPIINSRETEIIGLPTFSQAFRWFREKSHYRNYILPGSQHKKYLFEITLPSSIVHSSIEYNTYEEAELTCLDKLITIVK